MRVLLLSSSNSKYNSLYTQMAIWYREKLRKTNSKMISPCHWKNRLWSCWKWAFASLLCRPLRRTLTPCIPFITFVGTVLPLLLVLFWLETSPLNLPISHPDSWLLKLDFLNKNLISLSRFPLPQCSSMWPNVSFSRRHFLPLCLVLSDPEKLP